MVDEKAANLNVFKTYINIGTQGVQELFFLSINTIVPILETTSILVVERLTLI